MEFKESEIVRVKGGQQYPKVGGRLRLALEANEKINLRCDILQDDPERSVVRTVVDLDHGQFFGLGTANSQDDRDNSGNLLEVAQTRSIARALRFAGYGVETCGVEELRGSIANESAESGGNGSAQEEANLPMCTEAQIRLIRVLMSKLGISSEEMAKRAWGLHGVDKPNDLTKKQASELIDALNDELAQERKEGKPDGSSQPAVH